MLSPVHEEKEKDQEQDQMLNVLTDSVSLHTDNDRFGAASILNARRFSIVSNEQNEKRTKSPELVQRRPT